MLHRGDQAEALRHPGGENGLGDSTDVPGRGSHLDEEGGPD